MEEIIELLGNNINTLTYNTFTKNWTIHYKNKLEPNTVETEDLKEFLTNV